MCDVQGRVLWKGLAEIFRSWCFASGCFRSARQTCDCMRATSLEFCSHFHRPTISVGVSICSAFAPRACIWVAPWEHTHLLSAHPHYICRSVPTMHLCVCVVQSSSWRMWAECWEKQGGPPRTCLPSIQCPQSPHQWTHLPAGPRKKGVPQQTQGPMGPVTAIFPKPLLSLFK